MIIIISDYSSINSPCHVCETTSIWWLLDEYGLYKVCTDLISSNFLYSTFLLSVTGMWTLHKNQDSAYFTQVPSLGRFSKKFDFQAWTLKLAICWWLIWWVCSNLGVVHNVKNKIVQWKLNEASNNFLASDSKHQALSF